jgi:hypothetical protein
MTRWEASHGKRERKIAEAETVQELSNAKVHGSEISLRVEL